MAQLTVRGVAEGDAGGLAEAWEDARDDDAALDDRAFNHSSPTDEGLADWLIDDLLATSERQNGFVAVAAGLVRLTTYAASLVWVPFDDALGYERRSIVFLTYLDGDTALP